jgi:hypothetical protein
MILLRRAERQQRRRSRLPRLLFNRAGVAVRALVEFDCPCLVHRRMQST